MASTTNRPDALTVAPVTSSPTRTSTGTDSPVSIDSSTADPPSTTRPSVAIFSPGRTTNRSPTFSVDAGTSLSPASSSKRTSLAPRSSIARNASPARCLARFSKYRPPSTNMITPAATSRYTFAAPSVGATDNVNSCLSPGVPAVPRNSAYSDHANADTVPTVISVSIVASPSRRFFHVARWNGQPAHTTTGAVSVSASHCQFVNCSAGNIEIRITGTDSTTDPISRLRRDSSSRSAVVCPALLDDAPSPDCPPSSSGCGGGGSVAE